ncbi:40S small subunit processome assembly factor 1 [Menidia menidia]
MSSENNGGDEEDGLFLERVLDKLYDFGSAPKKKQKKKKRKRCEEVEEEEEEELPVVKDSLEPQSQQGPLSTQQTGPAEHLENRVEVVTFQDPRKKPRTKQTPVPVTVPAPQITDQKQDHQKTELSLEKARLEVHRFGITGYKKEEQRVFEQDRAVMLGARPPKKEYVNYKQLQQRIKEKKQKAKEDVQPDKKKKKKKKQSNQRDKKSASGSAVAPSGQVGRFKNGLLVLSPKEIQKIKARR